MRHILYALPLVLALAIAACTDTEPTSSINSGTGPADYGQAVPAGKARMTFHLPTTATHDSLRYTVDCNGAVADPRGGYPMRRGTLRRGDAISVLMSRDSLYSYSYLYSGDVISTARSQFAPDFTDTLIAFD